MGHSTICVSTRAISNQLLPRLYTWASFCKTFRNDVSLLLQTGYSQQKRRQSFPRLSNSDSLRVAPGWSVAGALGEPGTCLAPAPVVATCRPTFRRAPRLAGGDAIIMLSELPTTTSPATAAQRVYRVSRAPASELSRRAKKKSGGNGGACASGRFPSWKRRGHRARS